MIFSEVGVSPSILCYYSFVRGVWFNLIAVDYASRMNTHVLYSEAGANASEYHFQLFLMGTVALYRVCSTGLR